MTGSRMLVLVLIAAAVCAMSAGVGAADEVNVTFEGHFGGATYACAVSGNYAYIGQGHDLVVLDVSNPAAPSELGGVMASGIVRDVALSGDYAYVADSDNGLVIVDVSNKAAPSLAGSYDTARWAWDVAVSGGYAYVADGWNGLVIVDVSSKSAPTLAGSYDTGYAYGVAVSGDYAYVTDDDNGLVIVDVSSKSAPTLAGSYNTAGCAEDVAVSGDYAYVANGSTGLVIVDVSNKSAPVLAGSYDTRYALGVAVSGDYAYVADGYNGLVIVDVSNKSAPVLAGSYDTAGIAHGVAVSGDYAYVADDYNGLVIVDASSKSAPTLAGSYDTAGPAWGVAVSGDYAYVAGNNGLMIVDVSSKSAPVLAGSYDTTGRAMDVAVSGDYAYVADRYNGLMIVDVSSKSAPVLAGSYDTAGNAEGVAVSGDYAYVAWNNGLMIVDVSNKSAPVLAGSYDTAGRAEDVAVSGDYAYVADWDDGLVILRTDVTGADTTPPTLTITSPDTPHTTTHTPTITVAGTVSDPSGIASVWVNGILASGALDWSTWSAEVTLVAGENMITVVATDNVGDVATQSIVVNYVAVSGDITIDFAGHFGGGTAYDVAMSGDYAYVADGYNGLAIVDVSNPAAPFLTGSYDNLGGAGGVIVSGKYAYIAHSWNGLVIMDISNKAAPVLAGSYDTAGWAEDIAVSGDHAYVADGWNGLVIVDISNPTAPALVGSYDTTGDAYDVVMSGDYAYVLNGSELLIVDVNNPASPTLAGVYNTSGNIYGAAVSGDYAYISYFSDFDHKGFEVVDISDPTSPMIVGNYEGVAHRHYTTGRITYGIALSGNYAYVTNGNEATVMIIDISNPASPTLAAQYETAGLAMNIVVKDDYAYVADYWNGLTILYIGTSSTDIAPLTLNITSPANGATVITPTITVTGTASDPSGIASVTVNGVLASGALDWSTWSAEATLVEGKNMITVVATNNTGGSRTETMTVTYTTVDGIEIAYDDGSAEGGWGIGPGSGICADGGNRGYAIRMTTPDSEPFTIAAIKLFSRRYGEDCNTRFEIWDHDRNTLYSDVVSHSEYSAVADSWDSATWGYKDVPDIVVSGNFYIAMYTDSSDPTDDIYPDTGVYVGYDTSFTSDRSYTAEGKTLTWNLSTPQETTNWMIRAVGVKDADITSPTLNITSPADGTTVTTPSITVTGTASDPTGIASVTVNGALASGAADWSTWSVDVELVHGENTITVVATDGTELTTTETVTVTYSSPIDKYAILVGIDDYPGEENDLKCSLNSVSAMCNMLSIRYGFIGDHIQMIREEEAIATALADAFDKVVVEEAIDSNDILVFYFSGHGGRNETYEEEAICLHGGTYCWDFQLREHINGLHKDHDPTTIIILDSCHSGGMAEDTDMDFQNTGVNSNRTIMLMAAAFDERGWESQSIGLSVFTYFLYDAFVISTDNANSDNDPRIDVAEAFAYASPLTSKYVLDRGREQNPQIMDRFAHCDEQCYLDVADPTSIAGLAGCPIHLHAYDSEGRHTGMNSVGDDVEQEIPGSCYSGPEFDPETIVVLGQSDNITYRIEALNEGEFNFTVTQTTDTKTTTVLYGNVSITETTNATIDVNSSNPAYTMDLDYDGDGITDNTTEPTHILINHAPNVSITTPAGEESGNVAISYNLNDTESDNCTIMAQYSLDNLTWLDADVGEGGDGMIVTSTPVGVDHTFVWASGTGIPQTNATVYFRIGPYDGDLAGDYATTDAFSVDNRVVRGDLNSDGILTSADAVIVLEIAAGSRPCDTAMLERADVSRDDKVTSLDALMILNAAAGEISL
jgi:hypothetical protein